MKQFLTSPADVFLSLFAASAGALASAYYAQFALGLEPCVLCLYQRIPYAIVIALSLTGFLLKDRPGFVNALLGLCSAVFMAGAVTALYHSGIERHWWESAVEGCAVSFDASETKSLLETIMTSHAGRCDQIPWADPFLGLSMANYNGIYSLLLSDLCVLALVFRLRRAYSSAP